MDAGDVEDVFFSMWDKGMSMLDWLYEKTHVWENGEEDVSAPKIPNQLKINRLLIVKDLFPPGLFDELLDITDADQQKLLRYAVGCDHDTLEALYNNTYVSIRTLKYIMNRVLVANLEVNLRDLEEQHQIFTEHLARLETLSFEGRGGFKDEDYGMWYQLMYNVITYIRYYLNQLTCFFGNEPHKNNFAEKYLRRPFFFQTPLSPKEHDVVEEQRTRLKTTIQQLQELQSVLCKALIVYFSNNEFQSERSDRSELGISSDLSSASLSTEDTDDTVLIINLDVLENEHHDQGLSFL